MKTLETFQLQKDLAMYCRTGEDAPQTSIQENTYQYRRLVFNIVYGIMTNAYPLTVNLLGEEKWENVVKHFFENNPCQTPQVWNLPFELYDYFSKNQFSILHEYYFINELLYFEWLEIELFMMPDENEENFEKKKPTDSEIIVSNAEIRILPTTYPVHLKNAKEIAEEDKGQFFIAGLRNFESKRVSFQNLSYPFVEMMVLMSQGNCKIEDLIVLYSKYQNDKKLAKKEVREFIDFCFVNGLILGIERNSKN